MLLLHEKSSYVAEWEEGEGVHGKKKSCLERINIKERKEVGMLKKVEKEAKREYP